MKAPVLRALLRQLACSLIAKTTTPSRSISIYNIQFDYAFLADSLLKYVKR